ncbi:hypothetical protein [Kosmotoga pacifica]|uniref:Glycosyl transferase family 28 C-terminal domain-containing protein n=1 Tax=Kosmotoga pacifica TaxID=1330330 RepID=A0A0G2Z4U0_9BACT|nr:hypothetical protein [Kosmotoga pacifica]AKI96630.1 hypothetical protein IX53_00990 [Kosmotoga pacifica]
MNYTKATLKVKVAWYVTGHGFGHATRIIALARKILEEDSNIEILFLSQKKQLNFIIKSLSNFKDRVFGKVNILDIGLHLKSFDEPDIEKMKANLSYYLAHINEVTTNEVTILKEFETQFIVSDCVPHAFVVANTLGIRSLLLTNFTWVKMYEGILRKEQTQLRQMYSLADYFIQLMPFQEKIDLSPYTKRGFYCRDFNEEKALEIRKYLLKNYDNIVYFGMGMSVEYSNDFKKFFDKNGKTAFIVPSSFPKISNNCYPIPINETESQNFVMAADYVITKAGWSTVAESLIAGKAMVVLDRKNIPEDITTVEYLKTLGIQSVSLDKLLNSLVSGMPVKLANVAADKRVPNDISNLIWEARK